MRTDRAAVLASMIAGVSLVGVDATTGGVMPRRAPRAAACVPMATGTHRLPVEPGRVPVVLHVPPGLRPGAPLVLGLPGANQTASAFAAYTGYSALSDRKGFAVAYPTASGARPFWNVSGAVPGLPDDVAYLRRVIPTVVRAACADAAHVGATGVSNGGGMSARLACDAADLVSAVAPVAGGYSTLPDCRPARPVPMLEIHGVDDHVVPYEGKGEQRSGAVPKFLTQWRLLDGCTQAVQQRTPWPNVVELRSTGCAGGAQVVHDRIIDAEHGWPGEADLSGAKGFSSTRRTWAFLSAFGS